MELTRPMNSNKITKKLNKYQTKIDNAKKHIAIINAHFKKPKDAQKNFLSQITTFYKRGYYSPIILNFYKKKLSKYSSKLKNLNQSHAGGRRKSTNIRRRPLKPYRSVV